MRPELEKRGYRVFEVSASSHEGLKPLGYAMAEIVRDARAAVQSAPPRVKTPTLRVRNADAKGGFSIRKEERNLEPLFRVLGDKPVRWVQQTDFTNDEAVGYLADRLAKLGVEDKLFKAGAKPGDAVVIGEGDGVVFDWEPTMIGGAELLAASPRGSDIRIEEFSRPTREEKKEDHQKRRDARAAARAELEAERKAGIWTESVNYKHNPPAAPQDGE